MLLSNLKRLPSLRNVMQLNQLKVLLNFHKQNNNNLSSRPFSCSSINLNNPTDMNGKDESLDATI